MWPADQEAADSRKDRGQPVLHGGDRPIDVRGGRPLLENDSRFTAKVLKLREHEPGSRIKAPTLAS